MKNKNIRLITQSAVMLALLIGVQFITRSLGTFVTGALVNLILLTSTFLIGYAGGLTVALVSPFLAFFAGIGPAFIQIVLFISAGNAIFVTVASFFKKYMSGGSAKGIVTAAFGLFAAGILKVLFLWVGLVIIALPLLSGLISEKQAAVIGATFTWPQLVTASIGSALAILIVPVLRKALRK